MNQEDLETIAAARNVLDDMTSGDTRLAGLSSLAKDALTAVLIDLRVWRDEDVTDEHLYGRPDPFSRKA